MRLLAVPSDGAWVHGVEFGRWRFSDSEDRVCRGSMLIMNSTSILGLGVRVAQLKSASLRE